MVNLKEDDLSDNFKAELNKVRNAGFNPIAVTTLMCEHTFCFKTEEEAIRAHKELEVSEPSIVQGFWYGEEEFLKTIKEEEDKWREDVVDVYWL